MCGAVIECAQLIGICFAFRHQQLATQPRHIAVIGKEDGGTGFQHAMQAIQEAPQIDAPDMRQPAATERTVELAAEGRKILADAGKPNIYPEATMLEGAERAVELAR